MYSIDRDILIEDLFIDLDKSKSLSYNLKTKIGNVEYTKSLTHKTFDNKIMRYLLGFSSLDISAKEFFDSVTNIQKYKISVAQENQNNSIDICKHWIDEDINLYESDIKNKPFKGFRSKLNKTKAFLILVGGSEGGYSFSLPMAKLLSNYGYATLAIPYFGHEGLPKKLEHIPLEHFKAVWEKAARDMSVDLNKVPLIVIGRSRGAELSCLLGSVFKEISGVVAYSPSSCVWASDMGNKSSSWLHNNEEIPFASHDVDLLDKKLVDNQAGKELRLSEWYHAMIERGMNIKFEIKVENINGSILLFSGNDDQLWPSSVFADRIQERRLKNKSKHETKNIKFNKVGHCFDIPGVPLFKDDFSFTYGHDTYGLGGDMNETIDAEYESWRILLRYLNDVSYK